MVLDPVSGEEIVVRIRDVHKRFPANAISTFSGLSLNVEKGLKTIVIGFSGAGKSVLLKHILGLISPDRGSVKVFDDEITELNEYEMNRVRRRCGMLFQGAALFDYLNVEENVAFPLREHTKLSDGEIRDIVEQKLEAVGLQDVLHKFPNELSGGMRKRVGLARTLASEPEIIMYDEPTTGLDPVMTDVIDRLIDKTHSENDITTLVISHDLKAVFKIADRVAMLYKGKIIEYGEPEKFKDHENPVIRNFILGKAMDDSHID